MSLRPDFAATLRTAVVRATSPEEVRERAAYGSVIEVDGLPDPPLAMVEALVAAAGDGATVLLRVPNAPVTGEGAFEELRALLPADTTVWHEVPLRGAAVVAGPEQLTVQVAVDGQSPSHFVAAFGPRAGELRPVAAAGAADLSAERAEQTRLRADLAVARARGSSRP